VKSNKIIFTLMAAIMLGLTLNQPVQAYSLHVTDDADINKKNPSENTGNKKVLHIGNVNGDRESYVRFDLSALPKDAEINFAMLRLYVNEVDAAGAVTVHEVTGNWNERALTSANVPFTSTAFTNIPITKSSENKYVLVDVTTLVKGWQSGAPNNGLALRADTASQTKLEIDSKENEHTSHPMEIEVAFEGSPSLKGDKGDKGDPGIQGAKGDTGDTGSQGPTGLQGSPGPQGAPGQSGSLASLDDLNDKPCTLLDGKAGTVKHITVPGILFPQQVCVKALSNRLIDIGLAVVDRQTGLMWEKKVSGSNCLHCVEDHFTWCQATGNTNPSTACTGNTTSWIGDVNREGFAGFNDWRIPTPDEIKTLATGDSLLGSNPPVLWSVTEVNGNDALGVLVATNRLPFQSRKSTQNFVMAVRSGR
jgi:hypothetical protein